MPITIETLMKFCGDKDGRYTLSVPWQHDGYTYATDGRVCVRVPRLLECPTLPPSTFGPPPAHNLGWSDPLGARIKLPAEPPPVKMVECYGCRGKGTAPQTIDCEACNGTGIVECEHCGGDMECDECDGDGGIDGSEVMCDVCHGSGNAATAYVAVQVHREHGISDRYTRLLMECSVREVRKVANNKGAVHFAFDDVRGIQMLMLGKAE